MQNPNSLHRLWRSYLELLAEGGLRHVFISPGSRSAPLTLAFACTENIKTHVCPDERASAYAALGMAQALGEPVALVCTSGTAAYNFAPAVAEAFYLEIPLLVLTADRPPEWIGQYEGQALVQNELYGKHTRMSATFSVDLNHPDAQRHSARLLQEALLFLQGKAGKAPGPVHLNVPFREPFYPSVEEEIPTEKPDFQAKSWKTAAASLPQSLSETQENWLSAFAEKKILLFPAQAWPTPEEVTLAEAQKHPIITELTSNFFGVKHGVHFPDFVAYNKNFRPDLLITWGGSPLSKPLKLFLRKFPAKKHLHLTPHFPPPDTYQSLTDVWQMQPAPVLAALAKIPEHKNYAELWQKATAKIKSVRENYAKKIAFGEWQATEKVLSHLALEKRPLSLHLASSMPVRMASYLHRFSAENDLRVYANRGTAGIDGCTSTAVGHALAQPERLHVLLTGETAFLYDGNAFWQEQLPENLRVVVINNRGGGIFAKIKGPSQQPEQKRFFQVPHAQDCFNLAARFGLGYLGANDLTELENHLPIWLAASDVPVVLEVHTSPEKDAEIWNAFKQELKNE